MLKYYIITKCCIKYATLVQKQYLVLVQPWLRESYFSYSGDTVAKDKYILIY